MDNEDSAEEEDDYDSEYSDMAEAKDELEELKDQEGEAELDDGLGDSNKAGSQEAEGQVGEKRAPAEQLVDTRKLKRQKKIMFLNYYRGSFYGKSSASIFYQLSNQLNKSSKDMLWWWIVGLTDLLLHQGSDEIESANEISECNDEVLRLHPIKQNQDGAEEAARILRDKEVKYTDKDLFTLVSLDTQTQDVGTIMIQQELRLVLLRHWTLYDSIQNSNYVVSKLKIGREPGMKTFKKFLVTIGCSIEQAQQKF